MKQRHVYASGLFTRFNVLSLLLFQFGWLAVAFVFSFFFSILLSLSLPYSQYMHQRHDNNNFSAFSIRIFSAFNSVEYHHQLVVYWCCGSCDYCCQAQFRSIQIISFGSFEMTWRWQTKYQKLNIFSWESFNFSRREKVRERSCESLCDVLHTRNGRMTHSSFRKYEFLIITIMIIIIIGIVYRVAWSYTVAHLHSINWIGRETIRNIWKMKFNSMRDELNTLVAVNRQNIE